MCGSILEGMLLGVLLQKKQELERRYSQGKGKPSLEQWDLIELVEAAEKLGLLGDSVKHLSQAVRLYRNLVHPGRLLREKIDINVEEATIAINTVKIVRQQLNTTFSRSLK